MSKAKVCDWCGEDIGCGRPWVRVPVYYDAKPFVYHIECYCLIYTNEVLRYIINDNEGRSIVAALRRVLRALDPAHDDDE